jgi:hypothetical protein
MRSAMLARDAQGSIHGAQKPRKMTATMMTTRKRNSILVAFIHCSPFAGV